MTTPGVNRFAYPVQAYELLASLIAKIEDPAMRDVASELARMSADRDRALEDYLSRIHEVVVWSYTGALVTGTVSPAWHCRNPLTFRGVRINEPVAGALPVLIDVQVNNVLVTTVTLPAGQTTVLDDSTPIPVDVGDLVNHVVNDQGDGVNLSVQLIPA